MLRYYLRPYRGRVLLLTVLLLASIGLQLLAPQLLGRFVDAAAAGRATRGLALTAGAFLSPAPPHQTAPGAGAGWARRDP